jgi:hypothetical protein
MDRTHHYVFGHIALRQLFFYNPPGFVGALADRGAELVKQIWDDVGKKVQEGELEATPLSSRGLDCSTHDLGSGTVAVVVALPRPEKTAEAHFVGLVLRMPKKRLWGLLGRGKGVARYITLEHGVNIEGGDRTVLCEWSGEGHHNMGNGPEATVSAFVQKLGEMVNE